MRKKNVTMLDIASAVGVSQPTVSVILNESKSIKVSEETRQRVFDKAREMGYKFRNVDHSSKHQRIALVINSLNMHDPFINAISAAKIYAWERDALLCVFDYEDNEQLKQAYFEEIQRSQYCGVIFAANTPSEIDISELCTAPKRVLLNCYDPNSDQIHALLPADSLGSYRACEHLIKAGYKNIAMISGEPWSMSSINRVKGFRQALANHDLFIDDDAIVAGNWSVKQAFKATQTLLSRSKRPDAIFCASDLMAIGIYQALADQGLRIPEDIAVLSYDNQLLASELTPALSSVDLPYDEMGRLSVEMILDKIPAEIPLTRVEGELFLRDSTLSIKAQAL